MLKSIILPVSSMSLLTVKCDSLNDTNSKLCRPSELPLYSPRKRIDNVSIEEEEGNKALVSAIGSFRREVAGVFSVVATSTSQLVGKLSEADKEVSAVKEFLRAEENSVPRYGAIAVGGLTGYIYGALRGTIRKYVYTAVGVVGMASLCYPKEAKEYSQLILTDSKRYAAIAYNFALGVKPGEEVPLPELPKIPTNLSDVKNLVSDLGDSVKNLVKGDKS